MASHVDRLCRTAFLQLRDLRAISKYLDKEATHTATHAFVSSRIDYGNGLPYGAHDKQIKHVKCVQNVVAKLVAGGRKYDHVTSILKELDWFPIRQCVEYKCTLLAWKTVNGYASQYLQDRIAFQEHRSLQSKDNCLPKVPKTKLVTR